MGNCLSNDVLPFSEEFMDKYVRPQQQQQQQERPEQPQQEQQNQDLEPDDYNDNAAKRCRYTDLDVSQETQKLEQYVGHSGPEIEKGAAENAGVVSETWTELSRSMSVLPPWLLVNRGAMEYCKQLIGMQQGDTSNSTQYQGQQQANQGQDELFNNEQFEPVPLGTQQAADPVLEQRVNLPTQSYIAQRNQYEDISDDEDDDEMDIQWSSLDEQIENIEHDSDNESDIGSDEGSECSLDLSADEFDCESAVESDVTLGSSSDADSESEKNPEPSDVPVAPVCILPLYHFNKLMHHKNCSLIDWTQRKMFLTQHLINQNQSRRKTGHNRETFRQLDVYQRQLARLKLKLQTDQFSGTKCTPSNIPAMHSLIVKISNENQNYSNA